MDGTNNWKEEPERKRGADYITALIYSIFCSSSFNLPPSSRWAAEVRVWIGHIADRPGWAAPLLPLPFQRSLSLPLSLSVSPCLLLLSPTFFFFFFSHFLTLLLLLLLLHHSFQLWMPFSLPAWTQGGKEERVGWRTSGRNGRASGSFCSLSVVFRRGCVWPCEGASAYMPVSPLEYFTSLHLKAPACPWIRVDASISV